MNVNNNYGIDLLSENASFNKNISNDYFNYIFIDNINDYVFTKKKVIKIIKHNKLRLTLLLISMK